MTTEHKWEVTIASKGTCSQGQASDVEISICDDVIERLFDKTFKGWCPICRTISINEEEVVCCGCLKDIMAYHAVCGCVE